MTKKKNKFLTLCFALVPGIGPMYLGFMKMGVSLLLWFMGIFCIAVSLNLGALGVFSLVVWAYSFFLTLNINGMSDEDFYQLGDKYIVPGNIKIFEVELIKKYRKCAAVILILMGATLIWNNFMSLLFNFIPEELYQLIQTFSYSMPQIVVGAGIIILGFIMIRGKKKELFEQDKEQSIENISKKEDDTL